MKNLLISLVMLVSATIASAKSHPLPTVESVDVAQYIGKWYAVSSLPQFFTRKCVAQTAEYDVRTSDSVTVLNTCIKKNGSTETIKGQAVVANKLTNAELIVTFNKFWTKLFRVKGDYNILKLGDNYDTVMVGSRNRKSLWIMSRTPSIDEVTYAEYVEYAKSLGFDVSKLVISKF